MGGRDHLLSEILGRYCHLKVDDNRAGEIGFQTSDGARAYKAARAGAGVAGRPMTDPNAAIVS